MSDSTRPIDSANVAGLLKHEVMALKATARNCWNHEDLAKALEHQQQQDQQEHLPTVMADSSNAPLQPADSTARTASPESQLLDPQKHLPQNLLGMEQPGSSEPDTNSTSASPIESTSSSTTSSDSTIPQSPVAGTGSTATKFGAAAMPTVDQSAPGFYVSPNGSANGDGSKDDPFATLQQAQQAMRNSDVKTCYVEGGTYNMGSTLNLTSQDSGESFISVGGANNPAVLDGGGKLSNLINVNGANDVAVEGFSMQNTSNAAVWDTKKHGDVLPNVGAIYAQDSTGDTFAYNNMNNVNVGINMQGDSNIRVAQNQITNVQSAIDSGSDANKNYDSNITIKGNDIEDVNGWGSKLFDNVGAININGDTNVTIDNNVIQHTAGVAVQMNYRMNGSGFTVADNTINDSNYTANSGQPDTSANPNGDNGGIHIIVQPGSTKQLDGFVTNNFVENSGINRADKGIYLDDGVNDVTVSGNAVEEGGPGYAMQIHGGSNNVVDGNTFLLGNNGGGILYQTDGYAMTGNTIDDNNFEATGNNQSAYRMSNTTSGDMPSFSGNDYTPGLKQSPDPNGTTTSDFSPSSGATTNSENDIAQFLSAMATSTSDQSDSSNSDSSDSSSSNSSNPVEMLEQLIASLI